MTRPRTLMALALIGSMLWVTRVSVGRAADDPLSRAKELYQAAAYEEALTLLDSVPASAPANVGAEAATYRVFCLLALDRRADANAAIEALVAADPFYQLSSSQASPRIQSVFGEVRRAVLPSIVDGLYHQAKEAFERQAPGADAQFDRLLKLLDDPDVASRPSTADLKILTAGFRDLARARARAAGRAEAVAEPQVARSAAGNDPRPAESPATDRVVPPQPLQQALPAWRPVNQSERRTFTGTLELQIDATGTVTAARLLVPVHPLYDGQLVKAARSWKFVPATRNGTPIPWLKTMTINLRP